MSPYDMTEENGLTVEYSLYRHEVIRAFLHSLAKSPQYRNTMLLYSAILGGFTLLRRATSHESLTLRDIFIAIAWAVGFFVCITLWKFVRGETGKCRLVVGRDGITTLTGELRVRVPWGKIRRVIDTSQFVLIVRSNRRALLIPNRAFSGADQRAAFLVEVKKWMDTKR